MNRSMRFAPLLLLALCVAGGCDDGQGQPPEALRHYTYRAIGGFSMGSMTAATLGLRHHEQFDMVMPLGGAIDLGLFLHIIKDELMAGFCEPPELGRMCPATPESQTYERMNVGPESQGGFRRDNMIEAFQDMSTAMGNPVMFNPKHPYLAPGLTPEVFERSRADMCANPIRIEGLYDYRYNPEGLYPAISYCEARGQERGVFDPQATPERPVEITLAIDLNDNGVRDSGEPVLFQAGERFDDFGEDGLPSTEEPGYDPVSNPDPAGDDYHRLDNAFGTENNHVRDEGEPYLDYGLDGVLGTADAPYDWGEGNGHYDLNMNLMRSAVLYDPARLLKDLTDEELARLDFYVDVGIWDHLRFLDTCESFAGILTARGRPVDIRDGFKSLLREDYEGSFHIKEIDWDPIGRDVLVRYGHWDATPEMIADGDGGHVGDYAQVLWRFWTSVAYISARWPDGDFEPAQSDAQLLDKTFYSEILGQDRQYYIVLPPGYDESPDKVYPVLYMIHGIGMSATDLTASALFTNPWMKEGLLQKFLMVFPDGECQTDCFSGTFFLNQVGRHETPHRYEDAFFQELVPHIEATYRVRPPEDRKVPAAMLAPHTP